MLSQSMKGASMAKASFKISSRAAALIGRENVSRADGALIELIKNTYDADAEMCFVWLDVENDSILIYDNGTGMNENVIRSSWMVIGTNDKQVESISAKGRVKSGEKGIGRFALDRLGSKCIMYTKMKNDATVLQWSVSWDDFDVEGKLLDEIEADINECHASLRGCLPESLVLNIERQADLQNISRSHLWGKGTALFISGLRDNWTRSDLDDLADALQVLIPPKGQYDYSINFMMASSGNYETIENEAAVDFDYRIDSEFDGEKFYIELTRNEFIVDKMPDEVFSSPRFENYPFRKKDFQQRKVTLVKSIPEVIGTSEAVSVERAKELGAFSFSFLFMRLSSSGEDKRIAFQRTIGSRRAQWMSLHGGVKIYRDNFWVRPYGDKGSSQFDWLGLDARHSKNPSGVMDKRENWTVRNAQSQGTLNISRLKNVLIADKSSREGIIDGSHFKLLQNVLLGLIGVVEKDRSYVFRTIKIYLDSRDTESITLEEGKEAAKKVLGNSAESDPLDVVSPQEVIAMATTIEDYDKRADELMDELKLMRSLATNGLITSSIAHDLKGKKATLVVRAEMLKERLARGKYKDVDKGLSAIIEHDKFFKSWMDTLLNQIKTDRRKRKKRIFREVVEDAVESLAPVLGQKAIKIILAGESKKAIRLFEADINSIVYNLVINSIEAFSRNSIIERNIYIDVFDRNESIIFNYRDSGVGLGSEYSDPREIMKFGVTSKKTFDGNVYGTGLGMYIIDSTLSEYNASLEFVRYQGAFEIEIVFPG